MLGGQGLLATVLRMAPVPPIKRNSRHHLQPCQLYRPHRRRGDQEDGRVRPDKGVWRDDAGRVPREHVRGGEPGDGRVGAGRDRHRRPRRHHDPAPLVAGRGRPVQR